MITLYSWMIQYPFLAELLLLISLDVLLGSLRALVEKVLNSDVAGKGISKKAAMIAAVFVMYTIQQSNPNSPPIAQWMIGGFCYSELLSIFENLTMLGVPLPKKLTDSLDDLYPDDTFRLGDSATEHERIIEKRKDD